ncbi:hypothetical protein D3C75_743240 [compost metagenome]
MTASKLIWFNPLMPLSCAAKASTLRNCSSENVCSADSTYQKVTGCMDSSKAESMPSCASLLHSAAKSSPLEIGPERMRCSRSFIGNGVSRLPEAITAISSITSLRTSCHSTGETAPMMQ